MTDIKALVKKHHPAVVELRRHFHAHPELSTKEFNTQKRIMEELKALDIAVRPAANTGVIGELTGVAPGRTVAIRADIDALNIQDQCGKPWQSQNPGVCHACGHDGHTAMLLGTAKVLSELRREFTGTVRFLFQPTEERFPGGAMAMIKDGAVDGVDAIIGGHLWQPLRVGTIGLTYGRLMAAPDEFTIIVQGRGGHGSMPEQTVDPILTGAQIVLALNTIVSRNIDPREPVVLSLGMFQSGDVFNVIPDTALLRGTVRSFDKELRLSIFARIEQIVQGICASTGATYSFDKYLGYPPVINNAAVARVLAEAGREALGEQGVLEVLPFMGAEDFSYYLEKVPGAFMFIGDSNVEKGINYPQHHPKYDIDEDALANGMETMIRAALKLLKK